MQHNSEFLRIVNDAKTRVKEIDVEAVKSLLEGQQEFIIVDVREESEWNNGHLPHAIHLSKGIIECNIEKAIPEKDKKIIVYCSGGFRSVLAADNLQKMGYTNVASMIGGLKKWNETYS